MEFQDYYKIMGVERHAELAEIKKAYRKLAHQLHPDKNQTNPKAQEQFIKLQEAYEVLKDVSKRQKYNQLYDIKNAESNRKYSYKTSYSNYKNDATDDEDLFDSKDDNEKSPFSSFFRNFFDRKKQRYDYSYLYKGKDVKAKITIDLEEAFLGSNRVVSIFNEKLRIKIKPGVADQQVIKVKGKGEYSELGTERGDLFVRIEINPHQIFKRKGNDLYRDINVGIYTAIIGGKIQFETLHGKVVIAVPEGAKEGSKLRVKGKGMPKYSKPNEYGDLYVEIQYKMPGALTNEEISLLKKLREIENRKGSKG